MALQSVSLTLRRGRVHTLLGENDAGKSTLMKILAGLYSLDRGAIVVDGRSVTIRNPAHARAPAKWWPTVGGYWRNWHRG
ncbi:ATP-binding cassette domain-containing protein [Sodalis glossinidius]|uniref:ATP-binding cassette domain-containing protein n=1 Tax=Sodalis glossinidius TaxID=63612 RepID=UPI001FB0A438|nr:ATP-binding cassette domain-containing protein [Sodalis glossinidius]